MHVCGWHTAIQLVTWPQCPPWVFGHLMMGAGVTGSFYGPGQKSVPLLSTFCWPELVTGTKRWECSLAVCSEVEVGIGGSWPAYALDERKDRCSGFVKTRKNESLACKKFQPDLSSSMEV